MAIDTTCQFSDDAIQVLNRMLFDPNATHFFEHLSGGYIWSDEFPRLFTPEWEIVSEGYVHRMLVAARHDITLGVTLPRFRPLWQQVAEFAPNWPGLRPERRSESVRKRLLAAKRLAERCYKQMFDDPTITK